MYLARRPIAAVFVALTLSATVIANENKELERWLDQLVEISEPGFGYSTYFAGGEFLPYEGTGEMGVLVLGVSKATRSDTLRKVVEQGADAVPSLLKHLNDARTIKMEPVKGMMWMDFLDEYDYNRRTRKTKPKGVNRDDTLNDNHPNEHAVTVGDLCFVALGQIVNRNFAATRYQPSGGAVVSSPTYSAVLRRVILDEWSGLTRERHKKRLIDDFVNPDHEERLIGAYQRLAFYYPECVESLVLKRLAEPCYDVFKTSEFVREKLYRGKDAGDRKKLLEAFVAEHGEVARQGILLELFDDLDSQEATEEHRRSPPLDAKYDARACLIDLYGYPKDVRSKSRPLLLPPEHCVQARFIGSLTHDPSQKVGDAVQNLFLQFSKDDYFAAACLKCLASRGYGSFLVEQLNKIDTAAAKENRLHLAFIEAVSSSKEPAVRDKLLAIVRSTSNEAYFMAALPAAPRSQNDLVWKSAVAILDKLPAETERGEELLGMIGERFPDRAKAVYRSFLAAGSPQRAETLCVVLWDGNPLAIELLAPLLDDKRSLNGFVKPMRVCDRAATAVSQATRTIPFDSDWSTAEKDKQIEVLRKYCNEKKK